MARFFIDRPVFAWVIAIGIMMAGLLALRNMAVAQYPAIAPPAISVNVTFPGASAETVQTTVVQVIEQQLSGIDNLLYFDSQTTKDGQARIQLTFAPGTNADTAQVQVQNRVQLAVPRLPLTVQQQGIRVVKSSGNFLLIVGFVSTDGRMERTDISDFLVANVQDPISRTAGVGDFQVFGAQFAMRIWLDPAKLVNFGLTPADVATAVRAQNVQVSSGEMGALPAVPGQQLNATIIGPSYLQTVEEFGAILMRVRADGSQVRLRDVARLEIGGENYSITTLLDGRPSSGIGIRLASGANALDTAAAVRATIDRLRPSFPPGLEVAYLQDTTPFVERSIRSVVMTLLEAIVLVFLVMFVFLQNFRATLIPTLAIPVVLLGTFAVLQALGFSINTLTMFGLVLAIGLLVDDAIVVVENVERVMAEEHLSPLEATRKSMDQITGALIGIGLVLSAVFLPMAFFGGSVGVIYRQFSVTIATAMTLSVLVAIFFTPVLCVSLLRPHKPGQGQRGVFGWFNRGFERLTCSYGWSVRASLSRPARLMLIYVLLLGALGYGFLRLPGGFLPNEDQGIAFAQVTAPPGATADRTQRALDDLARYLREEESPVVDSFFAINGFSFGGRGQNSGLGFISLKDWDSRRGRQNTAQALTERINTRFARYQDALIIASTPPAVRELGNASGFSLQLVDRNGLGHEALMAARDELLRLAAGNPVVSRVRANGLNDEAQFRLIIDWERASALGLSVTDINTTLATAWGSTYVNDFMDRGRVKRVFMQGQPDARMVPADLDKWFVRNAQGQMVPFSAFGRTSWEFGSPRLERFNGIASREIQGLPGAGFTTGQAMDEMERLVARLPGGFGFEWSGISFQERQSSGQALALYALSLLVVFLCLAALYESWSIPTAVILAVPLGVLGAVFATWAGGMSNDVYFQVGLLATIGLTAKNAILIVEFAREGFNQGASLVEAAEEAARQRLRPIIMTSLAFTLGVVPLAIASGAGSGAQNAIGIGVIGGVVAGTVLAVLFVPLFFVLVLRLFRTGRPAHQEALAPVGQVQPGE
ncbi:efflux RND transporter permease subunit [Phreatobacter oligotrophus]|jgi:hydrophobe/amphiphile efflux-1 (HAE1) family protein|uniref:efflux RND transporter permease subunit n=1 Tax=Phreatobacter oligotrophus TaxID=1122261 RepID=UPI00235771DC|nr:efflux RND transporter permease subunit [Phreatobacter oligotrophus]MBX9989553.1 efflux RND transporter permease subunit [Phreatobacter oligotrophus]